MENANRVSLLTSTKMKAWIYDDVPGDQRAPHDSGIAVDLSVLEKLGLLPRPAISMDQVELIAAERSYKNRDVISVSKEGLGELYEEKLKGFFRFVIVSFERLSSFRAFKGWDCRESYKGLP